MADDAIDAHEDLQSITDKAELLAELRGVQVPVASSWPALGWWLLGTALLLALIGMVIHSVVKKRRAQDAWRIEALMELHHLKQSLSNADASDRHALLKRASALLRRVMMHLDGRESVANLTNDRWLDALDGHAAVQPLESSLRPLLTDAPYRTVPDENLTEDKLSELLLWMQRFVTGLPRRVDHQSSVKAVTG